MIQHLLYIFSFKNSYTKRILGIITGIALFLFGCKALNYLYVEEEAWSRIMFHNFYNQNDIDTAFIGSSHVFTGINPYIIESSGDENVFNISTSAQRVITSYYNLMEADRKYDIKKAYVEVFYLNSTGEYADYSNLKNNLWLNTDFYEPSFIKIKAFTHNRLENMPEAIFPFIRFREHLFDKEWINERIKEKSSDDYLNFIKHEEYQDGNGYYEYTAKGNIVSTRIYNPYEEVYQPELSKFYRKKDEMNINDEVRKYFIKIFEYCKKNDIELIMFSTPVYPTILACCDYDVYYNDVKELCNMYGVKYYDFNLCKSEKLPINDCNFYFDGDHMNYFGQSCFTPFAWNIFNENVDTNSLSEYFYNSYDEKIKKEPCKVYGLYSNPSETDENNLRKVSICADSKDDIIYKMTVYQKTIFPDGTESESTSTVYDYGEADCFWVLPGTYGNCLIEAYTKSGQMLGNYDFKFNIR